MNLTDIYPIEQLTIELIRNWETQGYVFYPVEDLSQECINPKFNPKYNDTVVVVKVSTWYNLLLSLIDLTGIEIIETLGCPTITEQIPGSFQIFNNIGYVAVLSGMDFTDHTNTIDPLELYTKIPQRIVKYYKIIDSSNLLTQLGVRFQNYNALQ